MASTSSDSGLYRTTSGSTASTSFDDRGQYTTSATSVVAGASEQHLRESTSQASLTNDARQPSPKRKDRKARWKRKGDTTSAAAPPATSSLPGFVPATTLTSSRQSPSPMKSVAINKDLKGKGRATELQEDEQFTNDHRPPSPSALNATSDESPLTSNADATNATLDARVPSPDDAELSSTDEMAYAPSPTVSPMVTPQAKKVPKSPATASISKMSPFKKPFTGFDFLEMRNSAVHAAPFSTSARPASAVGGLGIAGQGLEEMPKQEATKDISDVKQTLVAPEASKGTEAAAVTSPKEKKKITASPLTWNTNHRVQDAPTLGSPTLGGMNDNRNPEEVYSHAITKAAFSVNQKTILEELEKRKIERKTAEQQKKASQESPKTMGVSQLQSPAEAVRPRSSSHAINANEAVQLAQSRSPKEMWKKISKPVEMPGQETLLSPSAKPARSAAMTYQKAGQEQRPDGQSASLPKRSTVEASSNLPSIAIKLDEGAVEDVDDGASDASDTGGLLRDVTRDDDMSRGWEELDSGYHATSKARRRLQNQIYELNRRHRPSPEVIAARREMLTEIKKKLNTLLKNEYRPDFQYRLRTFGSTAYGLDTSSSDLDLCIIDPRRPDGFRNAGDLYDLDKRNDRAEEHMPTTEEDESLGDLSPWQRRKKQKWLEVQARKPMQLDGIYNVNTLAKILRKMGHRDVTPIPMAVVPIVKFKSRSGIKADMVSESMLFQLILLAWLSFSLLQNPNEQLGVRNSALLSEYVHFKPVIRPFLIFLKVWAKQRHLNDPSGSTGMISLSSYSIMLMAIAYLQHAGVLPNLQDAALIAKHGVKRQTFWHKIQNPDAAKSRQRSKQKCLGDYRAMAIDTTFVTKDKLGVSASPSKYNVQPASPKGKGKAVGWDSDTASETHGASRSAENPEELLNLLEGFFEYYIGFPIHDKAISVWRGRPIDRTASIAVTKKQARKIEAIRLKRQEQLQQARWSSTDSEDLQVQGPHPERLKASAQDAQVLVPGNEAATASDETSITEDEGLAALHAKVEAQLRRLGVANMDDSYEVRHGLVKKNHQKQKKSPKPATESESEQTLSDEGPEEVRELQLAVMESNANAYKGLELSEASPKTNLFPVPPVEDPERFIAPPTWIQPLVIQDPFIHTRNTAMNIQPETVAVIWKVRLLVSTRFSEYRTNVSHRLQEMERALEMIKLGSSLIDICTNIRPSGKARRDGPMPPGMRKRLDRMAREREWAQKRAAKQAAKQLKAGSSV